MNQNTRAIAAEALLDLNNPGIKCSYQSSKNICSLCDKTFNTIDPTRIRILWIKHLETDHMIYFATVHEEEKPLNLLSCHTCQKDFTSKPSLISCIKKFHEGRRKKFDVKDFLKKSIIKSRNEP